MGAEELGLEIANQRKKMNFTQAELAKGICSQPALSVIEKGEVSPTLENLFYFSLKLNKSVDYFLQYLIEDKDPDHINRVIQTIEKLTVEQKYRDIYQLVDKESESVKEGTGGSWFYLYLKWYRAVSTYHLKLSDEEETLINLKELLGEKYSLINKKDFLSVKIYNTIAFIHAENGREKEALINFQKALNTELAYMENRIPTQDPNIYRIRLYYNIAKTHYDLKNFNEAKEWINKGIRQSRKEENMSLLGNLYYYLGQCLEKAGSSPNEISSAYRTARDIFAFLGRDHYLEILSNLKEEYLDPMEKV
ncbi:hypothetical protein CR205_16335 [Alteribacter lacisalsi]|uniref:HTH cro/C1-type domain-containing protein n=1 Tax=Alteribacter lacisalsi TaxID=2045244 RepID=A0A2W0H2D1_9BACI|nr:helix-turn-helix domain-containing protein [Alteribacter lacisalsi]PYZ95943.1 hypothetical protein CR205_16335 [Alteribacter lacisalsi]